MKPVVYEPEAEDEIDHALAVSQASDPRVAAEFRRDIDDAVAAVAANPAVAARIPRTPCRRFIMTRFPYSILYAEEPNVIRNVAFAHHKRRPGYWKKRLRRP